MRPITGSSCPGAGASKRGAGPGADGGRVSPGALVSVVKADANPGAGTLPLMKNLYIAFRAATIDKVIEQTPNNARYFVGYVGWRPGELKSEVDRGLWAVVRADPEAVFQKDTSELWEDLIAQTRRVTADGLGVPAGPTLTLLKTPSPRSSSRP